MMIEETIFSSDLYYYLLLDLSPKMIRSHSICTEDVEFFNTYKFITPDDVNWDYEFFLNAQIYFNTKIYYSVNDSVFFGVYTDLYGRKSVVKNYEGLYFKILGDTLSNWVENHYQSLVIHRPEKIMKFKQECLNNFGVPDSRFDLITSNDFNIDPGDNKIFIGQK